ncbi:MAG TPA: F0F1 ATP synthase subunit epsilon, partial [Dehalococcoidia bacterium]|nr:F0F1 ATP synthase subunit epsilon [Dehalococcoidia bacterium]
AEERLEGARDESVSEADLARAQASMQRALLRLRVAERRPRRPGPPMPGG